MLLTRIDCREKPSTETYCANGEVRVVESAIGSYREAEGVPMARFVYRFQIENIGKPHLAVIHYPDDKRRFMLIGDGTTYDLSTGIITGHVFPISGQMQELRQVFWPRWRDCTLSFMTWGHGEPAAVSTIEIHELDDLPLLEITDAVGNRELGIQYEDCCGTGASEGAQTFSTWLDHVITFAQHTGQKLLSYPIGWYHGPIFPSERERSDVFSIVVAKDRKQYVAWTDDPPDWPATLLARFEREGLEFQGVLTLLRLSSVMKKYDADLAAIRSGAATLHNMLWNDEVQAGTMDWTTVYNTDNFPGLLQRPEPLSLKPDFDWAYGESSEHTYQENAAYRPGPIFNPLHPEVQAAIIGFLAEIGERYGKFSSFKGVAITMWAPTMIWFGSLHSGYDDFTTGLFEKETGIKIPVSPEDPRRFSKRYQYLIFQCREVWIDWRCGKIRDLVRAMRDALTAARADLRLTLNLWSEPYVPAVLGIGQPEHQLYARPSTYQLYREAGLDMRLFENEPNIELDLQTEGGGRDRSPSNLPVSVEEQFYMYRDHDFLDQETLGAMACLPQPGVFIFNAWHEAWGTHLWFSPEAGDSNLPEVAETYDQRSGKAVRINSVYAKDGFWWDSELRISPAFPPAPHFMEQYAHAVAEFDATRITRGGLFLDKSHGEEMRAFARAYRMLPRVRFETVGPCDDPVAARAVVHQGKRFFYLVNREYYPVRVTMNFSGNPCELVDLATGRELPSQPIQVVGLAGYELCSFRMQSGVELVRITTEVPVEVVEKLTAEIASLEKTALELQSGPRQIIGLEAVVQRMLEALREGRYAVLRRLLGSYPARKARTIEHVANE